MSTESAVRQPKPSCEYCGRCLSVCPSYRHHLVETMGPRARVDLCAGVADGSLTPGPRFEASLSGCLQCLACTEICGKGVDCAALVLEQRLLRQQRSPQRASLAHWVERWAVTWLLPRRPWLMRAVRVLARVQRLLPEEGRGTVRHVPELIMSGLGGGAGQRSMPQFSRRSLFEILPEKLTPPAGVAVQGQVALFSGCFGGVVNIQAAQALVRLLTGRGYIVHLPAAQSCCGAPALLSGFAGAFQAAQAHNGAVFARLFAEAGPMPVLTLCATCHRSLTEGVALAEPTEGKASLTLGAGGDGGAGVAGEAGGAGGIGGTGGEAGAVQAPGVAQRAQRGGAREALAAQVVDAAVFLAALPACSGLEGQPCSGLENQPGPGPVQKLRVAVHDPCHLRLHPECGLAARRCLQALPHVEVLDLAHAGQCCGGGGISSLKNPEVADALGLARAQDVVASGADLVLAQCPGCVLQLNNHLSRLNSPVRAWHLAEFLEWRGGARKN